MKLNLFSKIIFAVLLAFIVSTFTYFSFGNIYSSTLLNEKNFTAQYTNGIYQYRFLSSSLLTWIYKILVESPFELKLKMRFLEKDAEPKMFLAYYFLNTFFFVLSAILMVLITETKNFVATSSEKILMIAAAVFVIAITQFVLVPYDCSSYFFLLLFFYFLLKYLEKKDSVTLILLLFIIILSTLNRESSAISVSLAATLLFAKFGLKKSAIQTVLLMATAFLITYIGIRLLHPNFITNDGNLFIKNLASSRGLLGILFWLVFFALTLFLAENKSSLRNILYFHIFSIPYIFMCFYTGSLYETRLYVPLFLTSIFLSKISIAKTSFEKLK